MDQSFTLKEFINKILATSLSGYALKILLFLIWIPACLYAQQTDTLMSAKDAAQNSRMIIFQNGGLLLNGEFTGDPSGIAPTQGTGTRMMWYPGKGAFRAGGVSGSQWDGANIGDYSVAIGQDTRALASNSIAFGLRSLASQQSSFAVGEQNTASGAASVAMGYHAHTNARQGSFVFADRATVDTLRAGVNHSANWRVSGGFRMFTSSNLSTGVTIQSGAAVSNWGQANAVISTSTGALLTTGGIWQNVSDVHSKHRFEQISNEQILEKLRHLPITRWSYKKEDDSIRHIGPMAQDFFAAFRLGHDNRGIGTVDADGVALAGIKALEERTRNLAEEIESLKADNAALRQEMKDNNGNSMSTMALFVLAMVGGFALLRRNRVVS